MPFFYEHFKPQDYQHYPQNWAIVQDERGVMYVANKDGVLVYDGSRWQRIETETNTVVRSLARGKDGTVYASTSGDFGYLASDSIGTLRYVSLIENVKPEDRDFSDVWGTHATSEGLYFQTKDRLFRWDGASMQVWRTDAGFHTSFVVHDRFYVREKGTGLMQVVGDDLVLAPHGDHFADLRIFVMVPYPGDRILIGTSDAGFFIYDRGALTPFSTDADPILDSFTLYHGCVLPGDLYALATLGGGVLLIDQQGRLVRRFNKEAGFADDWINYVYADMQGGLWMALDAVGIARIDVPSQLTIYDDRLGLDGTVQAMERHQGALYVGTGTGLSRLSLPAAGARGMPSSMVDVLAGAPTQDLLSADSILFAATHEGLISLREGKADTLVAGQAVFTLFESAYEAGTILVGKKNGLARLHFTPDGWALDDLYTGTSPRDQIESIAESQDGTLWLRTANSEILRISSQERRRTFTPDRFKGSDGLPPELLDLATVEDEIHVVAKQGIFRFDPDGEAGARFYKESRFTSASDTVAVLRRFVEGRDGKVWGVYEDRIDIAIARPDGSYRHETPAVLRFPKSTVVNLFVEHDGVAWIGNGDVLVRYDPGIQRDYLAGFSAFLRRITATRTERVLYDGAPITAAVALPTIVDHTDHDLRFEVSAPTYNDVDATRYQYYMEGYDEVWSAWTPHPNRTYNDLQGGAYTLRVRARNGQGVISTEAIFTFRVLPPWYRTWWAYMLYGFVVLAVTAFSLHHRKVVQENKRAQEQARELERERLVNERLQQANQRLQEANERERLFNKRLQEANESLQQTNRLKDEFLANTSHELRTPLTAILGFAQVLKGELSDDFHELLDPIEINGQRLLNTINSLLDVAKLRAGMLEVYVEPTDVGSQAAEALRLLRPLAQPQNLVLNLSVPPKPVFALLDRHSFGRILTNLIGNAIKFTQEGGVTVEVIEDGERVHVHVRDTGIGIDESFLPELFNEFKQESTGLARSYEGNGLGLAITRRLVELLEGEITVSSKKGVGSVFSVSFPLYAAKETKTGAARAPHRLQPQNGVKSYHKA